MPRTALPLRRKQTRRLWRGQSLLEFALMLIPLTMVGFGAINLSLVQFRYSNVYQAMSITSRIAAIEGGDTAAVRTAMNTQLAAIGIASSSVTYCGVAACEPVGLDTVSVQIAPATQVYGGTITITVKYTYSVTVPSVNTWTTTKMMSVSVVSEKY